MTEDRQIDDRVAGIFHSPEPVSLEEDEERLVIREGTEVVVRPVPDFDSDEPIHSLRELAAAIRAQARRKAATAVTLPRAAPVRHVPASTRGSIRGSNLSETEGI